MCGIHVLDQFQVHCGRPAPHIVHAGDSLHAKVRYALPSERIFRGIVQLQWFGLIDKESAHNSK